MGAVSPEAVKLLLEQLQRTGRWQVGLTAFLAFAIVLKIVLDAVWSRSRVVFLEDQLKEAKRFSPTALRDAARSTQDLLLLGDEERQKALDRMRDQLAEVQDENARLREKDTAAQVSDTDPTVRGVLAAGLEKSLEEFRSSSDPAGVEQAWASAALHSGALASIDAGIGSAGRWTPLADNRPMWVCHRCSALTQGVCPRCGAERPHYPSDAGPPGSINADEL